MNSLQHFARTECNTRNDDAVISHLYLLVSSTTTTTTEPTVEPCTLKALHDGNRSPWPLSSPYLLQSTLHAANGQNFLNFLDERKERSDRSGTVKSRSITTDNIADELPYRWS